jgi:hypothetical protein
MPRTAGGFAGGDLLGGRPSGPPDLYAARADWLNQRVADNLDIAGDETDAPSRERARTGGF